MDGQYTSSGFQLYGQPLQVTHTGEPTANPFQAPTVQQPTQGITPTAPTQQVGGFTIIPATPGAAQQQIANLRNPPVQILQQPPAGQQKAQVPQYPRHLQLTIPDNREHWEQLASSSLFRDNSHSPNSNSSHSNNVCNLRYPQL